MNPLLDEAVSIVGDDEEYVPDFVLYIGGSIVSKRLKRFLRKAKETWVVNNTGEIADTFMNLTHVFQGDGEAVADHIRFMMVMEPHPFIQKWDNLLARIRLQAESYEPAYSELAAVKDFEHYVGDAEVHYANSSAIRLANSFAQHPVWCNRGVNGIEGSLSTAAGFSCVTDKRVYCVIGDLSFFYDQNALWNQNLKGNLRVIILNNHCGGIFGKFDGLRKSAARDRMVMGFHHSEAKGICTQNDCGYLKATNMEEMQLGIVQLLTMQTNRPVVLEVFTQEDTDVEALKAYFSL